MYDTASQCVLKSAQSVKDCAVTLCDEQNSLRCERKPIRYLLNQAHGLQSMQKLARALGVLHAAHVFP